MKSFLPWFCALGLLVGVVLLFSANQKLTREVAALRAESSQAQVLRAELEQVKTTGSPAQVEEIAQLRKKTEEVLKLRNEARQLREGNQQLTQQAQAAQAQAQAAQSRVVMLSTNLQAAQALSAQQQALAARYAAQATTPQQLLNACINNLRQLDGAKQQWALENRKTVSDIPNEKETAGYLKDGIPRCPAGGVYTLGAAGVAPTCSIAGHALPQ